MRVVRIGSIIIFYLSKLSNATFSILCDVIFLMRLQRKFDTDHSYEWKGQKWARSPNDSRTMLLRSVTRAVSISTGTVCGGTVGQLAIITRCNHTLFNEAVRVCCANNNARVAFAGVRARNSGSLGVFCPLLSPVLVFRPIRQIA